MSYDIKFRRRALEYWNDGHSKRATAEVFKVSATTLQNWKSQMSKTGKLNEKKRRETWRKIEPAKLMEFLGNLRAKLNAVSPHKHIKTIWGVGFRLAE